MFLDAAALGRVTEEKRGSGRSAVHSRQLGLVRPTPLPPLGRRRVRGWLSGCEFGWLAADSDDLAGLNGFDVRKASRHEGQQVLEAV